MIRRELIALAVLVCVASALFLLATPVDAHALLVRSDPQEGARLTKAPERVSAWFSEPIESGVSKLRVLSGAGKPADNGQIQFSSSDPAKVSVGLGRSVPPGFYQVTWETLSRVDGHFWFGSFQFTVLNPDGSEPTGPRPSTEINVGGVPTGVAEGSATKAAGLIGAAILIGGLAAALFVLYPTAQGETGTNRERLLRIARRYMTWIPLPAIALLAAVGGIELLLQARQLGGIDHVGQVLDTEWGGRWLLRQVTLGVIGLLLLMHIVIGLPYRPRHVSLIAALIAALNYLLLISLVSHSNAVAQGAVWATASDFIHLTAASAWIGGLVALGVVFVWSRRKVDERSRPPLLAGALWRFSLLAGTSLALLLTTGVFNALVQVPRWESLIDTAYGRALIVKLVLVAPLPGAAAVNAFVLRPRLIREAAEDPSAVERLRGLLVRFMSVEAALGVAVLAVAGVLTQYTPAHIEVEAARAAQTPPAGAVQMRDSFGFPLVTGNWSWVVAGGLALAAVLLWLWSPHLRARIKAPAWAMRAASISLSIAAIALVGTNFTASPQSSSAFNPRVGFRYQATDGRLVLLEIDPFQLGHNQFKVTAMTED